MDFTNEFTVKAPLSTVWEFMVNADDVTPCVPGAELTEKVDDTHFKGTVKVKLGAVQMSYRGEMEMVPDESNRTITLHAKGRETRGSGGASGTITSHFEDAGEGQTHIEIHSQIDVTGKVAQFGRGIMQDVANRLIKDFAGCLEEKITARASSGSDGQKSDAEKATATTSETTEVAADPSEQASASKLSGDDTVANTAPAPQSARATADSPGSTASELKITQILVDVFRSRAAGWLRSAAQRIEPK